MTTLSAEVVVVATPEAVWRILTDIAHYRTWHPFVDLEGELEVANEIDYFLRTDPNKPRGAPVTATITQLDEPVRFALKIGFPFLCTIEQWYLLDEVPNGTRVTHGSDFKGLLPFVAMGFARKRLFGFHDAPLQGLARRLHSIHKKTVTPTIDKPRPPRKGFRGYTR